VGKIKSQNTKNDSINDLIFDSINDMINASEELRADHVKAASNTMRLFLTGGFS